MLYYRKDLEFIKKRVLEISDASSATSNTLLIYQIFNKILSDVYSIDNTDIADTNADSLKSLSDNLVFETTGDLAKKIKKLKKIGVSSFGGAGYDQYLVTFSNYSEDDLAGNQFAKDCKLRTFSIPFDKSLIEEFLGSDEGGKDKKLSELLCAILYDNSASIAFVENFLSGVKNSPGHFFADKDPDHFSKYEDLIDSNNRDEKIENYIKKQTGVKLPNNYNYLKNQSSEVNSEIDWTSENLSDTDVNTGKFNSLGDIGKNLSHLRSFKGSESENLILLPLETKNLNNINQKFINGHDYYLRRALQEEEINFSGEIPATDMLNDAQDIYQSFRDFSKDIIYKLNLDYKRNINDSAGINESGKNSAYHLFNKVCTLLADGIDNVYEYVGGSSTPTDTLKFRTALWLFLLIESGEDTQVAEWFSSLMFWKGVYQNSISDGDIGVATASYTGQEVTPLFHFDYLGSTHYADNATNIISHIIQNKLGQTTVKSDRKKIWGDSLNVVDDSKIVDADYTVGNFKDGSSKLSALINHPWETNNIWAIILLGWCTAASINVPAPNYGFAKLPGDDDGTTGMTYGNSPSTWELTTGVFGPLSTSGLVDYSFYDTDYSKFLLGYRDDGKPDKYTFYNRNIEGTPTEDAGRSYGPLKTNQTQLFSILFLFASRILKASCGGKLSIKKGSNWPSGSEEYSIEFNKDQLDGLRRALRGESAPSNETGIESYDIANNIISLYKETITKKSVNILNRIQGLLAISNDFIEIANKFQRELSTNTESSELESTDPKQAALASFVRKSDISQNYRNLVNNFSYLDFQMYPKAIDNFLTYSQNEPFFASNGNITDTQVKLMATALSKKDHGYYKSETAGSKSILNIGIPRGLFEYLRTKAYEIKEEAAYRDTNFVAIQIFKNSLSPETVTYYPKIFIFDMTKFTIENNSNITVSQIENYSSNWEYQDLRDNFTFINYEDKNNILKFSGKTVINSSSEKELTTELVDNHIFDHYLKMYQVLTVNMDSNEYSYPVDPTLMSKLKDSDANTTELYDIFNNYMINNYPSANIDTDLFFEFNRVRAQVKDSLFFKINNKAKLALTPTCFDRVFTVMINEEDFILDNDQLSSGIREVKYDPDPEYYLGNKISINKNGASATIALETGNMTHKEIESHVKNVNNEKNPTINQYFCNISILPGY